MNEFAELRKRARERRDKLIAAAYSEWESTLGRIAELEQDLLGRDPVNHKSVASCVDAVIPTDSPFTTVDVMKALEALDAGRVFRKRSVDNHIYRLREKGLVRRLKRAQGREPALYARVGVDVPAIPFEGKTMREVMVEVLADKSMTQVELALAMIDKGYQTTMKPRALSHAVGAELRRNKEDFRKNGGKWRTKEGERD